jgi:hypothetical protein
MGHSTVLTQLHAQGLPLLVNRPHAIGPEATTGDLACERCGVAVSQEQGVHQMGWPWRRCPECASVAGREDVIRVELVARLLGEPLDFTRKSDWTAAHGVDFYSELDESAPTDPGHPERWAHIRAETRVAVLDDLRVYYAEPCGSPCGAPCVGCGATERLPEEWTTEKVTYGVSVYALCSASGPCSAVMSSSPGSQTR